MSTRRTLAVVTAGLSQPSSTRLLADRLAGAAADELRAAGHEVDVEVVELREHAHAIVDAMLTRFPAGDLADALDTVTNADGLVLVSPLFTTTYSGLFKSFLDIVDPDALTGTPVLLGATGGTARHSLALDYSMRPLLTYLRAQVVPTAVFAATDDWAGQDDDGALPRRIARAGRELAEAVGARPAAGPQDDPFGDTPDFAELLGGS
ncbi:MULTISPECIES: FMN reductase [Isoptericola]|uniref:FMN reductase n=1 Tax=Isoptericola sediminis TaxID=2733572 RepID=A0A849JS82_9MICO|nr:MULTISPECIES: FMN reductase [Isoptericola]MDO8144832.1 FMN reductase [Isoptericola sp. 178]MDO8149612.1 FMN reductase [Isoptericola sp. b515]MDO8152546.1 FMN reductase [Isoptericola sp. b408]NNU26286.1 FMN reductase [Isoptericola sediminis]